MDFILTSPAGKFTAAPEEQIPELQKQFAALGKALGRPVNEAVVERVNNSLWLSLNDPTGGNGKLAMIEGKKECAYCAMGSLLKLDSHTRTTIEGAVRAIGKYIRPAWSSIKAVP